MLSLTAFADELEREKARQRTYDAMLRKAKAGHVTGGRVFGYDNVDMCDSQGIRAYVTRRINEAEAAIVRRIFELSAAGHGVKVIAKQLNAEGAPSPRAQRRRSQSWAPTPLREVLPLYRGDLVWGQTAKRDRWGRQRQSGRPEADWIRRRAPTLQIVTEDKWNAAHACMAAARAIYLNTNRGQAVGRPPLGTPVEVLVDELAAVWLLRRVAEGPLAQSWQQPQAFLWLLVISRTRANGLCERCRRANGRRR